MGTNVTSIFAISDDLFAEIAAPAFQRAGFTPTPLRRSQGPIGSGIGFIDETGETCVAIYPGANLTLDAADAHAVAEAVGDAQAVLAQFEIADAPIAAAFALARRRGHETLLNPSPFRIPPPDILSQTSILVVNEVEAKALSRGLNAIMSPQAMAEAVFARGPHTMIVTQGQRGAIAYRRDKPPTFQPAFRVAALDSLGAGDAFLAAFAVGLVDALPFEQCLRQAAAAGALATLKPGVFDALATVDELHGFLAERKNEWPSSIGVHPT